VVRAGLTARIAICAVRAGFVRANGAKPAFAEGFGGRNCALLAAEA
jgi:hypothetical protein